MCCASRKTLLKPYFLKFINKERHGSGVGTYTYRLEKRTEISSFFGLCDQTTLLPRYEVAILKIRVPHRVSDNPRQTIADLLVARDTRLEDRVLERTCYVG